MEVLKVNVPGTVSIIDPKRVNPLSNVPLTFESWRVKAFRCPQVPVTVKVTETGSPAQNFVPETELIVIDCAADRRGRSTSAKAQRRAKRIVIVFMSPKYK